jgi:uncharacterized membrane protein YkoI
MNPVTTNQAKMQTKKILGIVAAVAIAGGGIGAALASGSGAATSRLDDGGPLLSRAKISEQTAIKAAQGAGSGDLFEVDLEGYEGHLVFNVDLGSKDIKVNAVNGAVLARNSAD